MGVDRILYGMVGLSLPYNKETGERIRKGLGISDEDWSKKYRSQIEEYFDEQDLGSWSYDSNIKGTYHAITDGMSGNYLVVGKILFDMTIDEFADDDFIIIENVDYDGVHDKLKDLFGLDVPKDEIQTIVFVHYT